MLLKNPQIRTWLLSLTAMCAFAGNSLLCRWAFKETLIDPVSFTLIRIVSGAIALYLILRYRKRTQLGTGSWASAFALFIYMAAFSYAYIGLSTGTGAFLLFGVVQLTMILAGLWGGERFKILQTLGFVLASAGLVWLLLPSSARPPIKESTLMLIAGIAWAIYSLRGHSALDPIAVTAGNFMRAAAFAFGFSLMFISSAKVDTSGSLFAVISGVITSGIGYAVWYSVLPRLKTTHAAVIQLSVPVIATIAGTILLNETITARLVLASMATLGGVGIVIWNKKHR